MIDLLVQSRRDQHEADRFFRRLLRNQGSGSRWLVMAKLRSSAAAHRTMLPTGEHIIHVYANNRSKVSHQPTRQREYHHAKVCFIDPGSPISHTPWINTKPISSWPPHLAGRQLSHLTDAGVSGLEGGSVCLGGVE